MNHIIEHDILCDEEDISFSCSSIFYMGFDVREIILHRISNFELDTYFFLFRLHIEEKIYFVGSLNEILQI